MLTRARPRILRQCASEPHSCSLIVQEMKPIYRDAMHVSRGRGLRDRQANKIEHHLRDGTAFPNLMFALSDRFAGLLKRTENAIQSLAMTSVSAVIAEVRVVMKNTAPATPETTDSDQKRKLLLPFMQAQLAVLRGSLVGLCGVPAIEYH